MGQAIDIEIPPPRPKRKPSNPYPRKVGVGTLSSQVGTKDGNHLISDFTLPSATHVLDVEKKETPEVHVYLCMKAFTSVFFLFVFICTYFKICIRRSQI